MAGLAAASFALSACATGQAPENQANGKVKIVTSTSVWSSVAQAVGGDAVEVEPLISDPNADPHSYESSPQDAAKVADADFVVFNGGGYDEFAEKLLESSGGKPSVQAFGAPGQDEHAHEHEQPAPPPAPDHEEHGHGEEPGHEHGHSGNEHIWYDLHAVHGVADRIADELGKLQPAKAQAFHDSASRFTAEIEPLESRVEQIKAKSQGKKVIVTEPVAHYLVDAAGLTDVTPPEFVNAVEAESDPAPAAVAQIQDAVNSRQAAAVLYNPQTESPVTEQIRTKAQQVGTPVVEMTETPPQGKTYVQWMDSQIAALDKALNPTP
jgi:zinc/manganese transport system substrate-binding protein